MNMYNFVPDPNSTANIAQQMQDYENMKFFASPLLVLFITIFLISIGLVILMWWFSRYEPTVTTELATEKVNNDD